MAAQYDRPHRADEITRGAWQIVWDLKREIAALKQQLAAALALSEERRAWMLKNATHTLECVLEDQKPLPPRLRGGPRCICGFSDLLFRHLNEKEEP